ncbi:glucoamylase family protein [Robiginitalea sp. M366]|uniref:glucoamylase family protein n=1 Tax=Robiginitalea aestuariiviva TaxID=3036903 RepID=UPI00240DE6FC|nr:glucoamylase family protein [Robiginitalea aestuariiviva]MDG1571564.1 glucoamylase family protein [Robiginitalea aestuariiviva]
MKTLLSLALLGLLSCSRGDTPAAEQTPEPAGTSLSDGELLSLVQQTTFKYFWDYAQPHSGAARERYHPANPALDAHVVTTGGSGFGLMALLAGMEGGLAPREAILTRLEQILDFFEQADRYHGAWPHWLDGQTGRVIPFSPMDNGGDLVETAFLAQGLVCIAEYFRTGTERERALSEKAETLWKGVEWDWYTQGQEVLYWHWSPEFGFAMDLPLKGYNETLIAYILAAAAPQHSISKSIYDAGWASGGQIVSPASAYGYPLGFRHVGEPANGGPLFWSHYSFLGLDPRNLSDSYGDYGAAVGNHARINYAYCLDNPGQHPGYSADCWGLTASYSPNPDGSLGYAAHSPDSDKGIIAPTAALSSLPYTPEASLKALRYFYSQRGRLLGPAGFYDAFRPGGDFWVAEAYLAIDQGPIVVMIENYRTGLFWELFMRHPDIQAGLDKLGFSYGN